MASTDFTIADVLAWARTKPADERYDYTDCNKCAVAQFGLETGRPELVGIGSLSYHHPELFEVAAGSGSSLALTFGGVVERCEAILARNLKFPVIKSDWLAIDAYLTDIEQVDA